MLSRRHRFHGYNSLDYTYRHGRTVRGPLTMLRYVPNPKRRDYRVAVVVSKKVNKSAVARNRIRRRIYEAVRGNDQAITGAYDIVITVFDESAATVPYPELAGQIAKQLASLKKPSN